MISGSYEEIIQKVKVSKKKIPSYLRGKVRQEVVGTDALRFGYPDGRKVSRQLKDVVGDVGLITVR